MSMINEFVEKLIERLKKGQYDMIKPYAGNYLASTMIAALDIAIEIIKELAEEYKDVPDTNVGKWILCSDRLPEDVEDVLVWFEYFRYGSYNRLFQTIGISYTYDGKWSGFVNGQSGWHQLSIIAWQPLPEPYKGE